MKSYCSFLIIDPNHRRLVESLCRSPAWRLRFIRDPSERFWFGEYGCEQSISHPIALGSQKSDTKPGLLIVVLDNEPISNNIIQLICAAYDVIEGNPSDRIGKRTAFELPSKASDQAAIFKNVFQTSGFFEQFIHQSELPIAVALAAKAWLDKPLAYAIHKLSKSLATDSITWWSTHPKYGQVFEKLSEAYSDHVNTSVAINLAFSAIEEINLQVKSSQKNKRFLDKKTGKWNPCVLHDIQHRLKSVGIEPDQTVSWTIRGEVPGTEEHITPALGRPAPYCDGQTVRDLELTIADALHMCSYLRNYMTAHAFGKESSLLGPYEVHNVQSVARRLVLSKSKIWNVWTKDLQI